MHRTILFLLTAALVVACGDRRPVPPPAAAAPTVTAPAAPAASASARADAIQAASATLKSIAGHRDGPGYNAEWRAYFAGAELWLIEERVADRSSPPFENRYYFEHGALFYYAGEQAAESASGAGGVAPRAPVRAEFRGVQAVSAVRIEHYGEVPLAPERVTALSRHAAELAYAARDEMSAPQVAR